jgi:hypothetical protein
MDGETALDADEKPWRIAAALTEIGEAALARAMWRSKTCPYKTIHSSPRETVVKISDIEKLLAARRHPRIKVHPAETGPLAEVAS